MELEKNKQDIRSQRQTSINDTKAEQKLLRNIMRNDVDVANKKMDMAAKENSATNAKKD